MNSRANQPDTQADIDLRQCIQANPPISFDMVAGAGSGKTTSLIKALASALEIHGDRLRRQRKKVACITYTEVAAGEIWADVGNNALVEVATIHSFLWNVTRHFQHDIGQWVAAKIQQRIAELQEDAANFGPRVRQTTRDRNQREIERYEQLGGVIGRVKSFTYGTGSNYGKGILGHADIIQMVPQLIIEKPLLRTLLAQQYPFIFVDESQDTFPLVVDALKAIQEQEQATFCLGFFGDPMQRIYMTGVGNITPPENWRSIPKPDNFRAPTTVLDLANAIRRDGDDLVQTGGRKILEGEAEIPIEGTARLFVLPSDGQRNERVAAVRRWVANANGDDQWLPDAPADAVKMLVIVHRMAASRLGFTELYSALNDKVPESFKAGFLDATVWPVRPFVTFLLPLAAAVREGREFDVMQLLRRYCPLLAREALAGVNLPDRLTALRQVSEQISQMMGSDSNATMRDVLAVVRDAQLVELDPRFATFFDVADQPEVDGNELAEAEAETEAEDDEGGSTRELEAVGAFLNCPARQIGPYVVYVADESPFSTQQGVKGAEFDRVLVVLDDEEGTHNQFSYEKYFGIKPLSRDDERALEAGREIGIHRTRRLFYVCCTRARLDLAVVFFVQEPDVAIATIRAMAIFKDENIHTVADLT